MATYSPWRHPQDSRAIELDTLAELGHSPGSSPAPARTFSQSHFQRTRSQVGIARRSPSKMIRVPFTQSPFERSPSTSVDTSFSNTDQPNASINHNSLEQVSIASVVHRPFPTASSSQTTIVDWSGPSSSPPRAIAEEELFLHVKPTPRESPATAMTRPYRLSPRDIDAIAHHLTLDFDQRERIPRHCSPLDLQHHIQTELLRRIHLGMDIGLARPVLDQGHHRQFLLSDSPFAFEIRSPHPSKESDENHPSGHAKFAFKKPMADLSAQDAHTSHKKSATWMELFFDLTFVANITIFTHQHPIVDRVTLLRYCGWFTILWWMWLSQTMFDVRFSTDDLLNRIWKLIQLFALAGFAGNGDHFTNTNSNGFALSYAVMKLVLVGEYFVVWLHAPDQRSRRPIVIYMLANFISFTMWWASAFLVHMLSDQARYAMWFGGIGIEVLTHLALANNATATFVGSHLPERLGLFTLIILGESVMGLFVLLSSLVDAPGKLGWDNLILIIFSISLIKCQWFLYFDDYHEQGPVRSSAHSTAWTYLHYLLHLSLLLLGVGCLDLIRIHQLSKELPSSLLQQHDAPSVQGHHARNLNERSSASVGSGEEDVAREMMLVYVKKYYLVVAANVFLWNAAIKYVTSRPGDKYDRAIYVSRFSMAVIVFCLLFIEHHQLGAFSLLGLEVGFCLLQVGHDLLVLYYAARKEFEEQQRKNTE